LPNKAIKAHPCHNNTLNERKNSFTLTLPAMKFSKKMLFNLIIKYIYIYKGNHIDTSMVVLVRGVP
jgi:hypothetical protein